MPAKGTRLRAGSSEWGRRRLEAGLSIRDLEARTGIHRTTLSLLERGRLVPTPEESTKILAVYAEATAGK